MTTHANNARALLIGVDDYRAFDPEGRHDLRGSVNDVRAWWEVCRSMGVEPEHVRVLLSPAHGASMPEIHGVRVEPATRENILRGVAWLAQAVGHGEQRTGLLTFSGHGDVAEHDLAICPSDVTPSPEGPPNRAIDFATLKQVLGDAENLTLVLDCGFAGAPAGRHPTDTPILDGGHHRAPRRNVLSLARGPVPASIARAMTGEKSPLGGRLITASAVDQLAYQADIGGRHHGLLTWALTSALLQWEKVPQGSTVRLGLSYATARDTAGKLLAALSYEQRPVLLPASAGELAFLQSGSVPEQTFVTPYQVDPGDFNYALWSVALLGHDQDAWILATNTPYATPIAGGTYTVDAPKEVWNMPSALLPYIQAGGANKTLTFMLRGDLSWPTTSGTTIAQFPASATVADTPLSVQSLTWSKVSTPSGVYGNGSVAVGFANMHFSGSTPQGSIDWYYLGTAPPTNPLITGSSDTLTWNRVGTPGSGQSWYHASGSLTAVRMTR